MNLSHLSSDAISTGTVQGLAGVTQLPESHQTVPHAYLPDYLSN